LLVNGRLSGERVTLDPDQQQGILRILTNTPDATACRPGAESWIYEIDYLTGAYIPNTQGGVVARRVAASALSAGARTLKLGEKIVTLITDERGGLSTVQGLAPTPTVNPVRRVSWRELDE
jgi:Tfp pilus tip-associated adhesin PilY1